MSKNCADLCRDLADQRHEKSVRYWLSQLPADEPYTISALAQRSKRERGTADNANRMMLREGMVERVGTCEHPKTYRRVTPVVDQTMIDFTAAATEVATAPDAFDHPIVAAMEAKLHATNAYYQSMLQSAAAKTKDDALRAYLSQICEFAP